MVLCLRELRVRVAVPVSTGLLMTLFYEGQVFPDKVQLFPDKVQLFLVNCDVL